MPSHLSSFQRFLENLFDDTMANIEDAVYAYQQELLRSNTIQRGAEQAGAQKARAQTRTSGLSGSGRRKRQSGSTQGQKTPPGAQDKWQSTLYDELEVSPAASTETIAAAYKALSRKYHPDVNKEAGAGQRMARVNVAYAVLKDQKQREMYDRKLREGING